MKFLRFFKNFYVIYLFIVVCLLAFVAPYIGYPFKRNFAIGNTLHLIIAIIIVAILVLAFRKKHVKDRTFKKIFIVGSIILISLEVFIVLGGWFIVGWDTRNVIFPDMQTDSDYMSMYPNQLFLAGLFRHIYNLNFPNFDLYYLSLSLISAFLIFLTVLMTTLISKKLTNAKCALLTFFLAGIFLGLSPWIMVPYSDNFAMFCTVLCLFLFCYIDKSFVKWPLIIFFSIIGCAIKPTAIFVLFVLLLVCIIRYFINKPYISIKNGFFGFTLSVLAIALSIFCTYSISNYGEKIDENKSFSPTHFLMMGVNMENQGSWNIDDVNFSRSFQNCEEREQANINEFLLRLNTYGPLGIGKIYLYKTMTNFGDGTFAWEAEKPWNIENKGNNPIIKFIYGIDPPNALNDNNNYFAYPWQVLWFLILIGNVLIVFKKKNNTTEYVICFTMLAISAFLTIFEPDPRYLLLYVPYMIILAPIGFSSLARKLTVI